MSNLDSPPATPAPPPPEKKTTLSTFNPQNTAKVFSVPQTSFLRGYEEQDTRSKQMLLLEDSASSNSAPVLANVDGKAPQGATPHKPAPKDVQELKKNLPVTQPSESPPPEPTKEAKEGTVSVQPEFDKPLRTPHQTSPQLRKLNGTQVNSDSIIKDRYVGSPSRKFSPILDRKLRNLKSGEAHGARDGPAASPLALLMAAKERDKQKSASFVSQENRSKAIEQPSASIQPNDIGPNSFSVTPMSSSSSSLTSLDRVQEGLKSVCPVAQTVQPPIKSSSVAPAKDPMSSAGSALRGTVASPSATNLVEQKPSATQSPSISQHTQREEIIMPLLPPPPEFGDLDDIVEPPPSMRPPDPPRKKAPTVTEVPRPPSHVPPPPPRPKIPEAPKLPPPEIIAKPMQQTQMKPKTAPAQLPATISPNQATLLSILQKKMMEMDPKMAPANEAESSSDDWGAPMYDEDNKVPVVQTAAPQSKNYPVVNKAATLNMQELERKVAKKYEETSSGKVPKR